MFPIRDDNPQIYTPYATYGLIALNIFAWLTLQGYGLPEQLQFSVCEYGLIPADIFGHASSNSPIACPNPSLGWPGIFTAMFMHGGWMHIIGNMWFLWVFGDNVEDAMGHWRYLAFYLLCVAAAAFAHGLLFIDDPSPLIGASGAVSGIVAAYLLLHPKIWVWVLVLFRLPIMLPTWVILGGWIAIQIGSAFLNDGSNVSFVSHLGGLAAGAILVAILKSRDVRLFDMQMKPPRAARLADHPVNNAKLPSMLERIGPKAKPQQPK